MFKDGIQIDQYSHKTEKNGKFKRFIEVIKCVEVIENIIIVLWAIVNFFIVQDVYSAE